jgi:hypothetical protein
MMKDMPVGHWPRVWHRYPSGPATLDLRWQTAGGWANSQRLQHPEGEEFAGDAGSFQLMCFVVGSLCLNIPYMLHVLRKQKTIKQTW